MNSDTSLRKLQVTSNKIRVQSFVSFSIVTSGFVAVYGGESESWVRGGVMGGAATGVWVCGVDTSGVPAGEEVVFMFLCGADPVGGVRPATGSGVWIEAEPGETLNWGVSLGSRVFGLIIESVDTRVGSEI